MSAYLTWPQARDLALAGTPVRRDAWVAASPVWLERRPGLWMLTDERHAILRVTDAEWFDSAEFFAGDWTTDVPGTERDVCIIDPPVRVFIPPPIGLEGEPGTSTIDLHADIGVSSPDGVFTISYFLDGVFVGTREAANPGRYTVTAACDWSSYSSAGGIRAWIDVRSSLPLPAWTGHAEWGMVFKAAAGYFTINLGTLFPAGGDGWTAGGWPYGAGQVCGPYADDRWVYAHSADGPAIASVDDDLSINGTIIHGDNGAGYVVPGGATELLLVLPAGQTFTLNVRNAGGPYWGSGYLRLYNRPI